MEYSGMEILPREGGREEWRGRAWQDPDLRVIALLLFCPHSTSLSASLRFKARRDGVMAAAAIFSRTVDRFLFHLGLSR